jgi:hypothetical protein
LFLKFEIGQICLIHFLKMSSFVSSLSFSSAAENVFTIFSWYCHSTFFVIFRHFFLPFSTFSFFFDIFLLFCHSTFFLFLLFKNLSFLIRNFLLAFEMGKTCSVEGWSLKIANFHSKKKKEKDYANWYFTFKLENDYRSIKNRNVFLYS